MKNLATSLSLLIAIAACLPAGAAELAVASSNVGNGLELLRKQIDVFEQQTGHEVSLVPMPDSSTEQFAQYRVWLSAESGDVDVYLTDVVWAPQLSDHFVDLSAAASGIAGEYLPSLIGSQTVDDKLVALPLFTSAPALFYRQDLLEKYDQEVPRTWAELEATAQLIMEAERSAGNPDFWGYVFQGSPYEGLTANALEWIISSGGGAIISADGDIAINSAEAADALERVANWVGNISPEGVLAYTEEESRGVWQLGNAAFMRNWPYAWTLGNFDDSAVKGKFAIAPLPAGDGPSGSIATLGGWNVAVSEYSPDREAAIELSLFLVQADNQKERLFFSGDLPTLTEVYEDPEVVDISPLMHEWRNILEAALPRPSSIAKQSYNEASAAIWSAAHASLSTPGSAQRNLELLASKLDELRGDGW